MSLATDGDRPHPTPAPVNAVTPSVPRGGAGALGGRRQGQNWTWPTSGPPLNPLPFPGWWWLPAWSSLGKLTFLPLLSPEFPTRGRQRPTLTPHIEFSRRFSLTLSCFLDVSDCHIDRDHSPEATAEHIWAPSAATQIISFLVPHAGPLSCSLSTEAPPTPNLCCQLAGFHFLQESCGSQEPGEGCIRAFIPYPFLMRLRI